MAQQIIRTRIIGGFHFRVVIQAVTSHFLRRLAQKKRTEWSPWVYRGKKLRTKTAAFCWTLEWPLEVCVCTCSRGVPFHGWGMVWGPRGFELTVLVQAVHFFPRRFSLNFSELRCAKKVIVIGSLRDCRSNTGNALLYSLFTEWRQYIYCTV
jgi:hypothetical protein